MLPHKLERAHWRGFYQRLSQGLMRQRTDIEITAPEAGIQLDARWLTATGLTYDPDEEVLDITVDGAGHLTFRPHELFVEFSPRGLESFCILDQDYAWQVVLLRAPLMLTA